MKKIKLMMKLFIYINALFFMTFYLFPSSKVFASFTDSASLNAGIKLTLGNLDLSSEQNETATGLTYLGGDPVLLSSHFLKNLGTLDGKLAYKIQVTEKGTTIPVNDGGTQLMIKFDSVIGDKSIPASKINSADYTFVTDNENNEWIFDGDPEKDVSVSIKYKTNTVPKNDRDIDITVTFLLVQTNASEPKETMFYDKIFFKNELKLKAEEVPNPNYWPADDGNWKFNGKVRYYDAQFENIMYFSELESGTGVRNLNDNVLYIELPQGNLKADDNFYIDQETGSKVKVEVMENRRFIKLTYSFEKSLEEAERLLSQPGHRQIVAFKYGTKGNPEKNYVQFDSNLLPLIHKRILLSSDQDIPGEFKSLPIYSTKEQQKISFKQIKKNDNIITDSSYLDQPQNLTEAKLNYKNLEAIVTGEPTLFDLSLHKADQKDKLNYLLINTSKATNLSSMNKNKLKIIIIGNTGNRLVIYRDLIITQ